MNQSRSKTWQGSNRSSNYKMEDNIKDMSVTPYNNADKEGQITGIGFSSRKTGRLYKYENISSVVTIMRTKERRLFLCFPDCL